MKKKKKIPFIIAIFSIISLIVVFILICILFLWNKENYQTEELQQELIDAANITVDDSSIVTPDYETSTDNASVDGYDTTNNTVTPKKVTVDFDSLSKTNKRVVGWLKVNNTNINYPVVQTTNNSYYLNHTYNNSYNSSGSIFADYKNNLKELNQNTVLYGHNRRNGSMFSQLNYTLQKSWYQNPQNHFINFNTRYMSGVWQIFSIYQVKSSNTLNKISFSSDSEFLNYINSAKQKSIYNFNVKVNSDDKILTLYTCGNNTYYRVIVHAKLLN